MAQEELRHRRQHFFSVFMLELFDHLFANGAADMGGQCRLHRKHHVLILGIAKGLMRRQVCQHFLCVFAAIDCEKNFHACLFRVEMPAVYRARFGAALTAIKAT
jgi:hypothetical protein